MRLNRVNPPITGKISKKRRNINMKTPKKKEILSFTYKNYWYRVLLPRTAGLVVDSFVLGEYLFNCFVNHQLVYVLKISGHPQRWPRLLPGAFLIPPALLAVADVVVQAGEGILDLTPIQERKT